uniref:Uncharacterized protein n=1 Tax=Psilocybe cubensis TaxID=181762 RepID=A0A8H7Y8V6_PSICU
MALRDFTKPGSWSSRLYDILRPAPHPMAIQFGNSQSKSRHSAGELWRHVLSCSIYHDLAGEKEEMQLARGRSWRRFVRMECMGLSGLLFYEINPPLSSGENSESVDGRIVAPAVENCQSSALNLTLESVFGNPDDPDDSGMAVDDLLDAVHARVVYFPAYACTSFITGQAMAAFFRDQPSFRPRPAPEGFSVPTSQTMELIDAASKHDVLPSEISESTETLCTEAHTMSLSPYSWRAICGDLAALEKLDLDPDDPYSALCVRTSYSVHKTTSSSHGLSDEEDGNATLSTIDSTGSSTPPPALTTSSMATESSFSFNYHPFRRSLPIYAKDHSIGFSIWTLKPSSTSPAVVNEGETVISATHSEDGSFLNCSLSYAEISKTN